MADLSATTIGLARETVRCNSCFAAGRLQRAGIELPQPFSIGCDYWTTSFRVVVAGINPGAGKTANYKQARKHALERFASGDDAALSDYFRNAEVDVPNWGNRRFLDRLNRLELRLREITIGNIALCATAGDQYPTWMLEACFVQHATRWLAMLAPHMVVLMGSATGPFTHRIRALLPPESEVCKMAHFAHRKGHAFEDSECIAVRRRLDDVRATVVG
jgi:hypothetical protein